MYYTSVAAHILRVCLGISASTILGRLAPGKSTPQSYSVNDVHIIS